MAKKAVKKETARKAARNATTLKRPAPSKGKAATAKSKTKLPPATITKTEASARHGAIGLRVQHVDFLSYKVEQVKRFYGEVLGFPAEHRDSNLNYLVIQTTPTSSIGFMPPHPKMIGDQPPPREPTLYFIVADVDSAFATLVAKGVAFMGPPQEMPWGHRVVVTTDPEGRTVMLGSELKKD